MLRLELCDGAAAEAIRRAFTRFRSTPRGPVDRLRRLADLLSATQDAELRWLSTGLRRYLDARGQMTLDAALLQPSLGGVSPWRAEALARRDRAIRAFAEGRFPGVSVRRQAVEIARLARQGTGLAGCPLPSSPRQIARILSGQAPV